MNEILRHNLDLFDQPTDFDYLFSKEDVRRQQISIKLLPEVLDTSCRPANLLSIACSSRVIEEQIQNRLGLRVFGIDSAHSAFTTAKKRGIDTARAKVCILPFEDNFFDYVYAGEIIEHIFDINLFLIEISRVLKKDGYFVLTTPNLAKIDDRFKFLFGKTPRQIAPLHPYLYLHIGLLLQN